jgi:hypothetical protein
MQTIISSDKKGARNDPRSLSHLRYVPAAAHRHASDGQATIGSASARRIGSDTHHLRDSCGTYHGYEHTALKYTHTVVPSRFFRDIQLSY